MVGEVLAGLSSLKAAFDIAKGLKDIDDATRRNAAVIELQEKILSAQESQATLIEKVGDLEKEVARLETWNAEKQRYQLSDVGSGITAYALKPGMESGEPPHYLCGSCYQHAHKSVLQPKTLSPGRAHVLVCHDCGWHAYLSGTSDPAHKSQLPSPYRGA